MAVRIKSITFDCADPCRLAQFWLQLTGFSEDPDNGNAPDDPEALLLSPDGSLAFARAQLTEQARPGRFGPAQIVAEQAPAIERLVAFLGRPASTGR